MKIRRTGRRRKATPPPALPLLPRISLENGPYVSMPSDDHLLRLVLQTAEDGIRSKLLLQVTQQELREAAKARAELATLRAKYDALRRDYDFLRMGYAEPIEPPNIGNKWHFSDN